MLFAISRLKIGKPFWAAWRRKEEIGEEEWAACLFTCSCPKWVVLTMRRSHLTTMINVCSLLSRDINEPQGGDVTCRTPIPRHTFRPRWKPHLRYHVSCLLDACSIAYFFCQLCGMRPAAWALLVVQQHVGLSFRINRTLLPPRVAVRDGGPSGRIVQVTLWGISRINQSFYHMHRTSIYGLCSSKPHTSRTAQQTNRALLPCVGPRGPLGFIDMVRSAEDACVTMLVDTIHPSRALPVRSSEVVFVVGAGGCGE